MSLADALEAAATANPAWADAIRPANGDPFQLLDGLDDGVARALLQWMLAEEPDAACELAEEWSDEEEGLAIVGSLSEEGLPKPGKKALRRILHRLRSRGVAVPEAKAPPKVARVGGVEDGIEGAFVSPLDPMGARFVYQLEANPQGGARLFEIIVDDVRGIVGFEVYSASRNKVRSFLRDLVRRKEFPALETTREAARALVARVAGLNTRERPAPRGFSEWRSRVADAAGGTTLPGDEVAAALEADDDAAALVALIEDGRIGPWPPAEERVIPLIERLREAADSSVIVSGATKEDQLQEMVFDALDEIFTADLRETTRHRFRETAWTLWKSGDEASARLCLGAAERFAGEGSLRDDPVARILLELPLRPAMQVTPPGPGEDEPAADEESLIVTP